MPNNQAELLDEVAEYYSAKLAEHGETPQGVDWNGEYSQTLRFQQICKVINESDSFSLNDLGCGYGALYNFLATQYQSFSYSGFDVSDRMIRAARQRHNNTDSTRFSVTANPDNVADYSVASGIFNVRLGRSDDEWKCHLESTLDVLDRTSRFGFSFNCLTAYSDAEKMHDYLYYANPGVLFELCMRRYSRDVALLHDYKLYEFTILVRKRK